MILGAIKIVALLKRYGVSIKQSQSAPRFAIGAKSYRIVKRVRQDKILIL